MDVSAGSPPRARVSATHSYARSRSTGESRIVPFQRHVEPDVLRIDSQFPRHRPLVGQ